MLDLISSRYQELVKRKEHKWENMKTWIRPICPISPICQIIPIAFEIIQNDQRYYKIPLSSWNSNHEDLWLLMWVTITCLVEWWKGTTCMQRWWVVLSWCSIYSTYVLGFLPRERTVISWIKVVFVFFLLRLCLFCCVCWFVKSARQKCPICNPAPKIFEIPTLKDVRRQRWGRGGHEWCSTHSQT